MMKYRILGMLWASCTVFLFVVMAAQPALAIGRMSGIEGYITNDGVPIGGVMVKDNVGHSTYTDTNGHYGLMEYKYDTYILTASATGWNTPPTQKATLKSPDGYAVANFVMTHQWGFYGRCTDEKGSGIAGAFVSTHAEWPGVGDDWNTADAYGWYWVHSNTVRSWGYKSDASKAGYWTVTRPYVTIHSTAIHQDYCMQSNIVTRVPIAQVFWTPLYYASGIPVTTDSVQITLGSGSTFSVGANVAGNGFTSTTNWGYSNTYAAPTGYKSYTLMDKVSVTGTWDMGTGKATSLATTTSTDIAWDYSLVEPTSYGPGPYQDTHYNGINTDVTIYTLGNWKGGYYRNIAPGAPQTISHYTSSSLTFNWGCSVSLAYPPASLDLSASMSYGTSQNTVVSFVFTNTDSNNALHDYKYYWEGVATNAGCVLHVWEIPLGGA